MFFCYFYGMKAFNRLFRTLVFIFVLTFFSFGQNDIVVYKDSIRSIKMLDSLVLENFGSIRICNGELYNCKGFISEFDNTGINVSNRSVRATIKHIDSVEFEIKYKFRKSKGFRAGRFKIYCLHDSQTLAVPINSDELSFDESAWNLFIASSSDQRDVVYTVLLDGEVVFYGMEDRIEPTK
jgi:hypothetical protein